MDATDNLLLQAYELNGYVLRNKERDFEEIDYALKNRVWITADKRHIPVSVMSTSHIKNCIKCWNGEGKIKIPSTYLGGKEKWLKIFNDELIRRQ